MLRSLALIILIGALMLSQPTRAQQLDDALRLTTDPLPNGARSLAMGGELIAASQGISALEDNPAALALLARREFTISFFNDGLNSNSTYFDQSSTASQSHFSLGSLGIAAPWPTQVGHFAMGISYDRTQEYNRTYAFNAVNPNTSLFNTNNFLQDPGIGAGSTGNQSWLADNNLAYALNLTDPVSDTGAVTLTTPYSSNLRESGTVTESGSVSSFRVGAAVDIAEGVSAGATLNFLSGSYDWDREYTATAIAGAAYETLANPLVSATISDQNHQDQTGVGLKFGLLISKIDILKFGLTIETPSITHIAEQAVESGASTFKDGNIYSSGNAASLPIGEAEYDVTTPAKFGAGASLHLAGLTASASATYQDMAATQFSNPSQGWDVTALNQEAQQDLRSVIAWQLGAEYRIPIVGLSIRAGYGDEPSPYKGDPSTFDTKKISAGVGIKLGKSVMLEAGWRHETYHTLHVLYNDTTPTGAAAIATIPDDAVSVDQILVGLNYRW